MKIEKVGDKLFDVHSDSGNTYIVAFVSDWVCTCPDFVYKQGVKGGQCKHIKEVIRI
jgi:predicted nucleic acid-binding Zn finger protein